VKLHLRKNDDGTTTIIAQRTRPGEKPTQLVPHVPEKDFKQSLHWAIATVKNDGAEPGPKPPDAV